MPIHRSKDSRGRPFYMWGKHGARYFYISGNAESRERAYAKAVKQAQAAYAHGYRGH
jgi:hypothetical protein